MNKYICTRTYSIQEYDTSGNKTEILVAVGQIMEEDNKYLDKKYCRLIALTKNKEKTEKEVEEKKITIKPLSFFKEHSNYCELNRYSSSGCFIQTVGCFSANMLNLYNSQFEDKTVYGEIFLYDLYED
jgi:hypothetical protein